MVYGVEVKKSILTENGQSIEQTKTYDYDYKVSAEMMVNLLKPHIGEPETLPSGRVVTIKKVKFVYL